MKPLIEAAIVDLCSNTNTVLPGKMVIADLGCSSGPNALELVSTAVEAIHSHCLQSQQPPPEVCLLLNDLPENDFNTVVKSLVTMLSCDRCHFTRGSSPVVPCILSVRPTVYNGSQRCEFDTPQWIDPLDYLLIV